MAPELISDRRIRRTDTGIALTYAPIRIKLLDVN